MDDPTTIAKSRSSGQSSSRAELTVDAIRWTLAPVPPDPLDAHGDLIDPVAAPRRVHPHDRLRIFGAVVRCGGL